MKDAQGHGSNPHGAHAAGVDQIGKAASVEKATTPNFLGATQGSGRDRQWYVQHVPTKTWLGSMAGFKNEKDANTFINEHLDPTNTYWRDAPNLMSNVFRRAMEKRKS